ncbi:LOW QUALITY PROTEIN: lysosomal alpha-mannosidase [Drosophila ficusphila]|uniref:LOW QUALITY PROTEIN: lysosomal alpha-mannosidase n=1 Tax=Drosophila ficusphila TaxID=30025 RepID=UPI001C8939ED|nr:LOW QUALITY PROTEIN: lysosomal alpha-mannosidase [Drosophila ficusphila]
MTYLGRIFLLTTILVVFVKQSQAVCGYESCPATKPNMVNIHLVPHSHNDVGWLKTVDQSYYGYLNKIHHAGVQYILDSVVSQLLQDPQRRFIQVETAFFAKWWEVQSESMKKVVKKLVNEGRFEFTGGAWSMNDEADVNYQGVIDQFTVGLKFLNETFGSCARPRVGWQIDTFGHSREQAAIFAHMGYDGQFFSRMDHNDKDTRLEELTMEMIWDASESMSGVNLFSGMLYNFYSDTPGFCFDILCTDEPIIDGDSEENNVEERVDHFITYAKNMSEHYLTNHIMVPMGGDFQYEDAKVNYKNMDKLIKYINERQASGSKYNIFYSTPSCYLNSLHQSLESWPNKTQDFFPYAHEKNSFWTGFFTSRPTQKRFERDGNHMLQVAKQLSVFANLTSEQHNEDLDYLRQTMGVMQHHDAITGTEKQAVSDDYDRMMYEAIVGASNNAKDALRILTNMPNGEFESCLKLNISECAFTKDGADNVVVTLYNPLAHKSTQYVRIPVKEENYQVTNEKGNLVPSEVVPVAKEVLDLEYRSNNTQHELVFKATVNKIGSYYIKKVESSENSQTSSIKIINPRESDDSETVVESSLIKLVIDNQTGRLKTIEMNGVSENIVQNFGFYKTHTSCAYTFRQDGDIELIEDDFKFTVYQGALVKEVHQKVNEWVSQVIRIYEDVNRVEFEWLVGPIPIDDNLGSEFVTNFKSGISSNGVFYTDSNGREMMKREMNKREDFVADLSRQPVSGNFYPVTSRIALQDDSKRLVLLNDRSQGGASLEDGALEMLIHRRHLFNDGGGVGEALNDTQYGKGLIARGKLYLVLDLVEEKNTITEREAEKELFLPFWKFFSKAGETGKASTKSIPDFDDLPKSVHLLTLESFTENEILIRFENFLDKSESNVISFNIRDIFDSLGGAAIRETTLDGNLPLSEMKRFKFHAQNSGNKPSTVEYSTAQHKSLEADRLDDASKFVVTLYPMQIRTFIIQTN